MSILHIIEEMQKHVQRGFEMALEFQVANWVSGAMELALKSSYGTEIAKYNFKCFKTMKKIPLKLYF